MPSRRGELGVAPELVGKPPQSFGAVVVFKEEGKSGAGLAPDAVAVGADHFAPLTGAASLGPPLEQVAVGLDADRSQEPSEEAVEAGQMAESLAGGQVKDKVTAPVEVGHVDACFGSHQGGTKRTKYPVERTGVSPARVRKRSKTSMA